MVAKRGIMFEFDTSIAPGAEKALAAIEKRVDALQKRMHMTLDVTERGRRMGGGGGGANGVANGAYGANGGPNGSGTNGANGTLSTAAADRQLAAERARLRRLSDMRRDADERDRIQAERSAAKTEDLNRKTLEQQIRDLKKAAADRQRIIAEAVREDARGWRNLSAMGKASFTGNRKVSAGFDALSDIGRAAMPRDAFAEGLQKMKAAQDMRSGWAGLGAAGADAQQRLNNLRSLAKKDDEERKRALEANKGQLREINSAAYDVVHAFGQLTRAAAQFGVVGQRDMMKVLDTIFAVEGGINALQGGMNAFRAIKTIRDARAGGGGGGAAKYAAGLARLAGGAGGVGGGAAGVASAAGGVGGVGLGLAGAGVTALAAGGIGLLGTIADRRRGVPGQVGGFWDTLGIGIASPVGSIQGGFLSLGSAIERKFNEPYGLTTKESDYRSQRLQEEEFEKSFGANGANDSRYAAIKRAKLHERRTELLEKYTQQEIGRRGVIREQKEAEGSIRAPLEARLRASEYGLEAQRYGFGAAAREDMGRLLGASQAEAFGRRQAAYAEVLSLRQRRAMGEFVSPAQEARARREEEIEQTLGGGFRGRRQKLLESQLQENRDRGQMLEARYREKEAEHKRLSPDPTSIEGMMKAGSTDEINVAYKEMLDVDQERKRNAEERVRLESEIKKLGIEGAREVLQIHEHDAATAKQLANSLRDRKQTDRERFGAMLPEQRMAVREAMGAAVSGHANRHQIETLDQFDFAREMVRGYRERAADAGGFEEVFGMGPRGQQIAGAERQEKIAVELTIKDREAVQVKLEEESTERAREAANLVIELMKQALQHEREEIQRMIQEGLDDARRRDNQEGRGLAIG